MWHVEKAGMLVVRHVDRAMTGPTVKGRGSLAPLPGWDLTVAQQPRRTLAIVQGAPLLTFLRQCGRDDKGHWYAAWDLAGRLGALG